MNILVVEDEPRLARHVSRALEAAGHLVTVAGDGLAAADLALRQRFDLLVLDVNLPGIDGFEVLRRLRAGGVHSRVLLLTARTEVGDRVAGLKAGADDYLMKPFAMEELLARVEVLGRRGGTEESSEVLTVSDVRLDPRRRKVMRGGEAISLSPREYEVLEVFMKEPGRVFTRDEICERIWEREHEYDTRTVEIFIMRVRKKLDEGRSQPLIRTVRGIGYMLAPEES